MVYDTPIKYSPEDIMKKEARGLAGSKLSEKKELNHDYVITEKGITDKDRFHIPKKSIIHVDRQYVWFGMTEEEEKQYKSN